MTPQLFVELVLGLVLLDVVLVALLEVLGQNDVPAEKTDSDSSGFHVTEYFPFILIEILSYHIALHILYHLSL